jgi:hypothetical protein
VTFLGKAIPSTACFRASRDEDPSALRISLSSETLD